MRINKKDKAYFLGGLNNSIISNLENTKGLGVTSAMAGGVGSSLVPQGSQGAGALKGAAAGAQLGQIAGPWGMAAGAVVGGAAGLISAKRQQEEAAKQQNIDDLKFRNKTLGINEFKHGGKKRKPLSENDKQLYKIDRALQLGYTPDSTGHMSSRDYETGMILKYPAHPTFNEAIRDDRALGYTPMVDPRGDVYTVSPSDIPKKGFFSNNTKANGGMLTEFNNGGTHEQNPFGGIPQGMNPDGGMNKVEENETKWQDYIFSDRLKLSKGLAKQFNLPNKYINKSFSDISKKMHDQHKERPNDPISQKTVESNMDLLMNANDVTKAAKEAKENLASLNKAFKSGGVIVPMGVQPNMMALYDGGGYMPNEINYGKPSLFPAASERPYDASSEDLFTFPNMLPEVTVSPKIEAPMEDSVAGWQQVVKNAQPYSGMLSADNTTNTPPPVFQATWDAIKNKRRSEVMDNLKRELSGKKEATTKSGDKAKAKGDGTEQSSKLDAKALRYAPIAFDFLAGAFSKAPKSVEYDPTLIEAPAPLKAAQYDIAPARAAIDNAYQTGINSLSNNVGGSGAALRSGLAGLTNSYYTGLGNAYLGAEERNLSNKQNVDQYNLQAQQQATNTNAQLMNQADLYNNQMLNNRNTMNYDNRLSYIAKGFEGLGDIGYEERNREILPKLFGYTDLADYSPIKRAHGGRMRIRKSK